MPRGKRKLVVEENAEVSRTPRVTRRSTRELKQSDTNKSINNCITEAEDAGSASQIEVDSTLETMIEPKTEESTLKMTQTNNNPASDISDTSSNKWMREIDLIIPTMKPRKSRIRKPRGIQRKTCIKLKPVEINNNPGCDAESTALETCVETESMKETNPKSKRINQPRVRAPKEIINSEAIERDDCLICESAGDRLSDSYSKGDSISEIVKPEENLMCPTDDTPQKTLPELELSKMDYNIECKTNDTCSIIKVPIAICDTTLKNNTSVNSFLEIDSISEILNPEMKHVIEVEDIVPAEVERKSQSIERSHHPEPTPEDTPSGASIHSPHLIPNTTKPKTKRGRPSKKLTEVEPTEMNITPGKCETNDTLSVPKVGTNLLSDAIKPKPKRICDGHAKVAKKLIEAKPLEENVDLPYKSNYILSATQVDTDLISATMKPKMKRVRKSRAKVRDKVLQSGNIEMNNNSASETELTLRKNCSQADSVIELLQMKDNSVDMLEETLQEVRPETNSVTVEPLRTNDEHMNEVNNSSSKDHDLNHSISKIVEDKYHPLDSMYQPKVLLWNIAYSDKLSPKQKEMLLKKNESEESLTSKNLSDTSTSRSMERSTPSDITITSSTLEKRSDEIMKSVPSIKDCEYEHSNSGEVKGPRKEKTRRESEILTSIKQPKMPRKKLMELQTHTKKDILSSVKNKKPSIQRKLTPSPKSSLKQCSSKQQNDSYKTSRKSSGPRERNIVIWPRSDTIELNAPLDLSISTTDVLISSQSEFANSTDTSVGEFCPRTNKHQLWDMNAHGNGFGSSIFNERDLSTSFTKIDDSVNLPQPDTVSKLSDMLDICENQDFEFKDETITFYKAPESVGRVSPPTTSVPKCVIKETSRSSDEKSPSSDEFSIKVSIPAKHYFNKRTAMCKELDRVLKQVKAAPTKAQMKSYAVLNEAHHPPSENTTTSISDQEPSKINSIPAKSGTPTKRNNTTTLLQDMCRLNDTDTHSPKTLTKSDANVTAFEPTLLGSTMKLTASNIRSLPRIVNDELLPKDTITFTSNGCVLNTLSKSACMEIGDASYSNNVNEINERKDIREVKTDKQSTSAVNVSQARTSARFETHDHAYAAAEIDIIDIGHYHDTVDNFKEFKNVEELPPPSIHATQLDGINSQKFPEKMETEITDQSSVVQQHFDSTQLWKICPELAMYFGHDDVVNNNNDNNLVNNDTLNTAETNCNNNSVHTFSTAMKPVTNEDHTTGLPSNDVRDATSNSHNREQGVIAVKTDYIEMEEESSDYNASNDELNAEKNTVLADLTTTNLRNFNSILNHNNEGGVNWSIKTYQHYLLHGDMRKTSSELAPNDAIEVGCKLTESTAESHTEFSQIECKKRKRKWIQNENDTKVKPMKERRLKLNRNRWSMDPQDFESTSNSQKQTSVHSIGFDNSVALNLFERAQSTKMTSFGESNPTKKTNEQPNFARENKESSPKEFNCKAEDLVQGIVNCTQTNEKNNEQTSTIISAYTTADVDSKTLKCGLENNSPKPLGEIGITLPQNTQNHYRNAGVDRNGNFTSSSSSSSSSSQSSKSISNSKEVESQPNADQYQKEKKVEDEVDSDCISLFAESIFTSLEHATSLKDTVSMSPLFDLPTESDDKFQDMVDVGTYFEKNIQECNEAYESCVQNVENMGNIEGNMKQPNFFANENPYEISLLQTNINQPSNQCSSQLYPPTTAIQRSNVNNILNLRDKLRANCGAPETSSVDVESLFTRHCYQKLKRGFCNKIECRFFHHLAPSLRDLEQNEPNLVNKVIDFAIFKRYYYFIRYKYSDVVMRMDYPNIIRLFYKLSDTGLMNKSLASFTFSGVKRLGISLQEFVSDIASWLTEDDVALTEHILRMFAILIEPGVYWDTFRDLLIRMKPSSLRIRTIVCECIHSNKDKAHIEDVYKNYLRKLTVEQLSSININLRRELDLLLIKYNLIPEPKYSNQPPALFGNINFADKTLQELNASEDDCKIRIEVPTILSPDDTAHYNHVNVSHLFSGTNAASHNTSSQKPTVTQILQHQNSESQSVASNHNFSIQRHDAETQVNPSVKQYSSDLDISRTSEPGVLNLSSSSYQLYPIDDLQPPRSVHHDRHWMFHLAMHNLKEALKHEEYLLALKILNRYSDKNRTIFVSSCYKMLRENVMTSSHHVKNMIKLSVRMRVNKFLKETLFTLGMYMMIELCDTKAWVLAYRLFKCMRRSASLTDKNAAFDLISAEICLANRRPLKAFTILKQNNMLCESRSKWNVVSNPNDEHVRVMIVNLLLDVLCREYPDRAFYIFTHCLRDQARIYHPIDLTAHIDNLVTGALSSKCDDLITNVTRMIFENNFTLEKSVFQSLVVNIFQYDVTLCRQLYCYGTWLGVYPIVKLTLPLHILIKTNWRKEEIYLVIADFLEKLSMDIGPAIDHITPNQFTIHLVFELAPFKQQLANDNVQICNKDELKASKEMTKTVLREQFNPPLRTIVAERERFMKLQNRSVVTYLKSMNVQS